MDVASDGVSDGQHIDLIILRKVVVIITISVDVETGYWIVDNIILSYYEFSYSHKKRKIF